MQQRQLRLGDILDDYCPRERRVTNHAVVAMVGDDVKQTRCTTCDCEHEYKHAKVPRQRRKNDAPAALYAQVAAGAPKRVTHETPSAPPEIGEPEAIVKDESDHARGLHEAERGAESMVDEPPVEAIEASGSDASPMRDATDAGEGDEADGNDAGSDAETDKDEGPIHRRLIRASLPRPEGQQPPARPIPEFTIRQPGGRPNRFRPRHQRGSGQGPHGHGHQFGGNRSNGNIGGPMRGPRQSGGRVGGGGMMNRRGPGGGRKRSK